MHFISETYMINQSYLKMREYKIYHTTHPSNRAKGGSTVIVKDSINYYEEGHIQRLLLQLTMIDITSTKQKLQIGEVYCPPKYNLKRVEYKTLLQNLSKNLL